MDVGEHAALGDGDAAEQLVELLVVADGELQVTGNDTRLLVVAGRVASQLEDFGGEVLEHSGEVDGRAGTDALRVVAAAQQTVDTTDGERETGLVGPTGRVASAGAKRARRRAPMGKARARQRRQAKDTTYVCDWPLPPAALPPVFDLPPVMVRAVVWVGRRSGETASSELQQRKRADDG